MNIGLMAHDSKKKLMQNFCIAYKGILCKHNLYATGTTGRLIENVANLTIHKHLAGSLGGDEQLGSQIENNELDLMIFLRDPNIRGMHGDYGSKIPRLCDVHNIPLATNLATAETLVLALDRGLTSGLIVAGIILAIYSSSSSSSPKNPRLLSS